MARRKGRPGGEDPAEAAFRTGLVLVREHPLMGALLARAYVLRERDRGVPDDGYGVVTDGGAVLLHPGKRLAPEEWAWVIAHALVHLAFGHLEGREPAREWNAACCAWTGRFLKDLKLGRPPAGCGGPGDLPARNEEALFRLFCDAGIPAGFEATGIAGPHPDLATGGPIGRGYDRSAWAAALAEGLEGAVARAVELAGGKLPARGEETARNSPAELARRWFMASFPLLGALAAAFRIVEDRAVCQRLGVQVAAVDAELQEIYLNPGAALGEGELRYVMAHELLHVGLRHQARALGRDPWLWNVACDYVINGWLEELKVGKRPSFGALYDPALAGLSAETIYDRIAGDLRRLRRLATFRGVGEPDMLARGNPAWWETAAGADLDAFYRRCLAQGLELHRVQGRGLLPAGLVEEIRALDHPPIPWDVALARWFDERFAPLERRRSFARPSRRQMATPDIPRPRWLPVETVVDARTFGVVLDTSGSMDRRLLGLGLGAIASYALAREVARIRLVFCDAEAHDEGWVEPAALLDRVRVKGRGGTRLQPGIELLERAPDFPREGPVLVVTDGDCDRLEPRREHAFLVPAAARLPFTPRGPVFRIRPPG